MPFYDWTLADWIFALIFGAGAFVAMIVLAILFIARVWFPLTRWRHGYRIHAEGWTKRRDQT